jgi:hypothetical protein
MAKLTLDGSVLLWEMVQRNLPAIRVQYDLTFIHRLDGVRMIVWCDARKSYNATQSQWAHLTDDASWSERHSGNSSHYTFTHEETYDARNRVFSVATASQTTRVEIIPEAGPDVVTPEQIAELTKIGNEMVKDFLAATFLEAKPGEDVQFAEDPDLKTELATQNGKEYGHHGINFYRLKEWNESMNANLDYQFRTKAVIEGHFAPQDNLSNLLAGQRASDFLTQIDLDPAWYKYLDVHVLCTADFDNDPVDLVTAKLSYRARGPQGDVDTSKQMVFRKDSAPGRFATYLASPSQRSYDYTYEVHYKGTNQTYSATGRHDGDVLVLDADRLGILRVEVQMGLVNWDAIRQVLVSLSYGSGSDRRECDLTLDKEHDKATWTEVIGRDVDQPYTYRVTFVDKTSQRLPLDPETSTARTLVVNQPLGEDMEVVIAPAGVFGDLLSQVVVAVRYDDRANGYLVDDTFTFTKSESKIWKVPLRDKRLRRYDYQVTVFYTDGVTREDAWRSTDKAILAVGDPFGYRVQVSPYLLKNPPGAWQFGTIHLSFADPQEGIRAEKDLEITDFSKPLFWRFRTGSPDRHTYRYQLTLFKADGTEVKLPEKEESREVLVLIPPPPA